ncbi:hypothetical protein Leryth_007930 [Lithospermum erythrorhizon]|nr:hypothetical protein Leryth_007930 [Lithospermum erythrorhizon]
MSRRSKNCLRCCLVVFAVISALCVSGPVLYWKFKKGLLLKTTSASCSPCVCKCAPPLSLPVYKTALEKAAEKRVIGLQSGRECGNTIRLTNLTTPDCGKDDPDLKEEMEKQTVDLLSEELKLQETVSEEQLRHMNIAFGEARRAASQYQKEAEKCNAATETCEAARERAEALMRKEKKATLLWEKRARQLAFSQELHDQEEAGEEAEAE